MKTKFFTMLFAALYAANVFGGSTVTFTASDFSGQGVSGTGGNITATKSGVTFTCDKAFGDASAARCYMDGVVTIISSSNQIEKIEFVFTDGKTGNLNTEYTVNAKQWTSGTLASQARMKTITVYLGEEAGGGSESGGTTGEATDGSFVGFEASSDHKLGTQIYEEGLIQNENNVTLLETDVTKHQYNINLINGGTGTFTMGGVTFSFTNEEAGKTAYKTYDQYIQPNGLDREITIPTKNGEQVKIVLIEDCAGILVNGVSQDFVAGDNILTATGSSIVLKNVSAKPKINAILSFGGGSTPIPDPDPENYENVKIGDLYYNLDATNQTAEVTYQLSWDENNYSGLTTANIPSSVTYNNITFSVTSIGDGAFFGCSSLTFVTIPNSVTSIGHGVSYSYEGITTLEGGAAFKGCSGLTSITLPNSITKIDFDTFEGCTSLTSIEIPNSVTSIGDDAFRDCTGLTSVTIPNSVTSIGVGAFESCSGLTSVTIGNRVTSIGGGAFFDCEGLTSITIPNSVTSIGKSAFAVCTGLTSIIVESGNTFYDSRNDCNAIIETATNTLIAGCQSTIIPNSVTSIGDDAFSYCTGLTSIRIPNSVTSIGGTAFNGCSGLTSITIPNSVTSIGDYAFNFCKSLSAIFNYASSPQVIDSDVFGGEEWEEGGIQYGPVDKTTCKLYVPAQSINLYKAAEGWKEFVNILPLEDTPIETDEVVFVTTETTADMSWQEVTNAYTYELIIRDGNGAVVCTLVFDAEGHLQSITFHAPKHNHTAEQAMQSGFSFTINGLASGTTYSYTFLAKDSGGNVVKTITGTFTTQGEEQGINEVQGNDVQGTKILRDGQIIILRGEKTYTVTGQEVR